MRTVQGVVPCRVWGDNADARGDQMVLAAEHMPVDRNVTRAAQLGVSLTTLME